MMYLSLITGAVKSLSDAFSRWMDLRAMDKRDLPAEAKAKSDYDAAKQGLDFSIIQAELWLKEKLLLSGAWRTPLVLASGGALILVAVNNIVAAVYFDWARPIDMLSPPMGVLAGMFLLLVTGSTELFMRVFNGKQKPDGDNPPATDK